MTPPPPGSFSGGAFDARAPESDDTATGGFARCTSARWWITRAPPSLRLGVDGSGGLDVPGAGAAATAAAVDVSSSVFSVPGPFDFLCAHAMTCTFPSPSPA